MPLSSRSTSIRRIEESRSLLSWPVLSPSAGLELPPSPVEVEGFVNDAAPNAYERFDRREPGWHKVVLKPSEKAA